MCSISAQLSPMLDSTGITLMQARQGWGRAAAVAVAESRRRRWLLPPLLWLPIPQRIPPHHHHHTHTHTIAAARAQAETFDMHSFQALTGTTFMALTQPHTPEAADMLRGP